MMGSVSRPNHARATYATVTIGHRTFWIDARGGAHQGWAFASAYFHPIVRCETYTGEELSTGSDASPDRIR
jgi:hypothetical protein